MSTCSLLRRIALFDMNILFKYYYDKNDRKDLQVSEQILDDFSTMEYLCTKSLHSKNKIYIYFFKITFRKGVTIHQIIHQR